MLPCAPGAQYVAQTDTALSPLSKLEHAAHEETLTTLCELFPDWSRPDVEAVLSSCKDNMNDATEVGVRGVIR